MENQNLLKNKYDIIIIGGGLSGLSLALELTQKKEPPSLLLLEERKEYKRDRTWCFWNALDHPFKSLIKKSWNSWQVREDFQTITHHSTKYSYHCISSDSFYEYATKKLREFPSFTCLMNAKVLDLKENLKGVEVKTIYGTFFASLVYDSRPDDSKNLNENSLYQHFYGLEIRTKDSFFSTEELILMDFDVDQKEGLNFMYLLPFLNNQALVESTYISPSLLSLSCYENSIKNYLKNRYGIMDYEVIYTERGVIPLKPLLRRRHKNNKIIPIGQKAGWIRASTGYAFLEIQREIQNLLKGSKKLKGGYIDHYLDIIFLSYLRDHQKLSPKLFFDLFKKNPPDRLIPFLTGRWSIGDLIAVIASMPKLSMIKQVFK